MSDDELPQENDLEGRQGNLYPVGKALRRTFDAENHDSLGNDLTGLMLELARIDPGSSAPGRGAMPPHPAVDRPPPGGPQPIVAAPSSWWSRMVDRLLS